MSESPDVQVGDIIQMQGPTVPRELWDKYFRVTVVHPDGTVSLSLPYTDEHCRVRYFSQGLATSGQRRQARGVLH